MAKRKKDKRANNDQQNTIGSCKSNNQMFMTTTASLNKLKTQNFKETNNDLQSTTQKTKEYGYRNCEIDYVTKTHPQKISYCYPS
jgi:hypothetical protein